MVTENKKVAAKTGQTKKNKEPDLLVYIGPNMGGDLPMTQFTVYRGGLPKLVQNRFNSDPDFARLFVDPSELDAARAELKNKSSLKGQAYTAAVKSKIKGGI